MHSPRSGTHSKSSSEDSDDGGVPLHYDQPFIFHKTNAHRTNNNTALNSTSLYPSNIAYTSSQPGQGYFSKPPAPQTCESGMSGVHPPTRANRRNNMTSNHGKDNIHHMNTMAVPKTSSNSINGNILNPYTAGNIQPQYARVGAIQHQAQDYTRTNFKFTTPVLENPLNSSPLIMPVSRSEPGNMNRDNRHPRTRLEAQQDPRMGGVYQHVHGVSGTSQVTEENHIARPFQPSYQALGMPKGVEHQTIRKAASLYIYINPRYEGEINDRFLQNKQCPENQNCSVWLTGIPTTATDKEVLATVTEGKVFAFNRKAPVFGRFDKCAADLTFFDRQTAERYILKAEQQGVYINGHPIYVIWNKNRKLPAQPCEQDQTRVVKVRGNHSFVNEDQLEDFLHQGLAFTLVDKWNFLDVDSIYAAVLEFGKVLGQSRAALHKLRNEVERRGIADQVTVSYGLDPCDTSYTQSLLGS
ncbi:hypothetical protein HYFRA_00002457 [Hymenoscyphus fraxineus]|uniref:Uncharacterized protein n=1 Tax=Hymenoscyphus fraxineus TaxID=746836 RepID=A0A9N9PNJ9_9HELO|nr:hypothetical protein HYFRA_00002457 [Hymenoscyphus fraxineus]